MHGDTSGGTKSASMKSPRLDTPEVGTRLSRGMQSKERYTSMRQERPIHLRVVRSLQVRGGHVSFEADQAAL